MAAITDNDFQLFGLDEHYSINLQALQKAFLNIQKEVHPDKFSDGSDAEKRMAMQWATRINEAYQRLKHPTQRAAYLCELRGHAINAESNTAMPNDFLMQQMLWREALEEATAPDELDSLCKTVRAARKTLIETMAKCLDVDNKPAEAVTATRQLMFLDKFEQELERTIERLEN